MDSVITPKHWLWVPRTKPIHFIEIHSTRGGSASPATDYQATMNWMQNPNNGSAAQGWGGSCSYILGPNGEMCTVLEDNQQPTYCAGYGGPGTWAIDEYGIAYEWAQNNPSIPYSDAMYKRGAKEIAAKCKKYNIPIEFLTIPSQTGPVPKGIVRHDRCENGAKLGKSDPGIVFDEIKFLGYLMAEMEDDMSMAELNGRMQAAAKLGNEMAQGVCFRAQYDSEWWVCEVDSAGNRTRRHVLDIQSATGRGISNPVEVDPFVLLFMPQGAPLN